MIRYVESGSCAFWDCWRDTEQGVRDHLKARLRSLGRNGKWRARRVGYVNQSVIDTLARLRGSPLEGEDIKRVILTQAKR